MKSRGVLLMIVSTFLFSIQGVCVKWIGTDLSASEIAFIRALGTLALITPYLIYNRIPLMGSRPGVLILRGLIGGLALDLGFYALQHLPLSTASLLRNLHPVMIPFIAAFALKEVLHSRHYAAIGLSLLGITLVYLPGITGGTWPLWPGAAAVTSSFCTAAVMCLVRSLRNTENTWVIVNYFALGSMLVTAPGFVMAPVAPSLTQWGLLSVIIVVTALAQLSFTWALGHESASKLGILGSMGPVWAGAWGISLFNEYLTLPMLAGATLILGGTALAARIRSAIPKVTDAKTRTAWIPAPKCEPLRE